MAADAIKHGADACLNKPADAEQILGLYQEFRACPPDVAGPCGSETIREK
jgi:ActR/RegA family two-component response regulator